MVYWDDSFDGDDGDNDDDDDDGDDYNDGRICVVHHSIVSILGGKLVMNSSSLLTCTSTHNPVEQHTLRFYFDGDDLTEVIMMLMLMMMMVIMVMVMTMTTIIMVTIMTKMMLLVYSHVSHPVGAEAWGCQLS